MIREPFQTLDEIREYRSGNRIQCLVCGKYFRRLQTKHLKLHEMTADDYRETFGIPWNTSLTSAPSREASGSKMTPERIEAFKKVLGRPKGGRRPNCLAVRHKWAQSAERGRYHARRWVTIACAKCGGPVETTALTATVQPICCMDCTTPGARKARISYWKHKQAA